MKKWRKSEKQDMKGFGLTPQRGSGNQDHYPTDGINDELAVETKYTDAKSFRISLELWHKLVEETATLNVKDNRLRVPVLSIHLQNKRLVVLEYEEYKILADKARKYDELQH